MDMFDVIKEKNAGIIRRRSMIKWVLTDGSGDEASVGFHQRGARFLINKDSFEFCFVVDFPMYELDETTDSIIFTHNPFSMPQGGMEALLTSAASASFKSSTC